MLDPLANLAKTLSPSDPQTPVPSSASPFTVGIVATVNLDGTVTANVNASTKPLTVYWTNASNPKAGQKIIILPSPEGVQYAIGVVGSATELPPLMAANPVGAIWVSTLSANPSTYMGFGTWVAAAQGRTFIGAGTSDATYAGGAMGGASTQTIYPQFLPAASPWGVTATQYSHYHNATQAGHYHGPSAGSSLLNNSGPVVLNTGGTYYSLGWGTTDTQTPAITVDLQTPVITVTVGTNSAVGGTPLPTVPPYLVIYAWQRVA
jgi:hypothetical protein